MYSPKMLDSFIQYIGSDNSGTPMFFENRSKVTLSQSKSFDLVGKRIRNVSIQCQNGHPGDVIIIEINGKRIVDKAPILQSFVLPISDSGMKVKDPIIVTILSDVTNQELEVVVLFGVDCSI